MSRPFAVPAVESRLDVPRVLVLLLAACLATAGLVATAGAPAQADARTLYDLVNKSRQQAGLPALVRDSRLDSVAQKWSNKLSYAGKLSHNPSYSTQIPGGWTRAGENVGYDYSDAKLHAAWMASKGHKDNILGGYTSVGIGWTKDADGRIWGTQVFATYPGVKPPTTAPAPPPVAVAPVKAASSPNVTAGPPAATSLATFSTTSRTAQVRRISATGMGTSQDLGGGVSGAPAVVNRGGVLEVFVRGTNDRLYASSGSGSSWSAWKQVPAGVVTSAPAAVIRDGVVEVYFRDAAGRVAQVRSTSGGWSGVAVIGGAVLAGTAPAATVSAGGVQLSVVGTNRAVYTMRPGQHAWKNLGGGALGIATVTDGSAVHVVVRGTNDRLYAQQVGRAGWRAMGGLSASVPRAGLDASGNPVSVVLGTNGALYLSPLDRSAGWSRVS